MTLIACPIFISAAGEVSSALDRAGEAVRAGARLIEWRIEALAEEPDAEKAIIRLVRESPSPCIVTCRSESEGGLYGGDDQTRISLLEAIGTADHPPRYIDLELAAYERSSNLRQKIKLVVDHPDQARPVETSLILSAHDFERRPADLLQKIERMSTDPACAIVKVAWTARSLRDNLDAFDLLTERAKPTIALCMGEFGLMSRVLAPKFGGLLTFASVERGEESAPGQPTIQQLRTRYRFDSIGKETRVYGVIGWPVAHSRSPHVHNTGFDQIGFDGVYLPMPIPPEYEHFKATVGSMIDHPRLDFRGASVTIPHKEHLVRFVRERGGRMDAMSERIGAANTLIVGSAGGLECINTDAPAAVRALCDGMGMMKEGLHGKRIAVLGAGGVARAVCAAMMEHGTKVVVFNRSRDRAQALIDDLKSRLQEIEHDVGGTIAVGARNGLACGCFHVFINCTSIGMAGGPAPDDSSIDLLSDEDVALNDDLTVFDTVYTPARTPLIAEAEARGARVITGKEMFLHQAAMQFEVWAGRKAPIDRWRTVLEAGAAT